MSKKKFVGLSDHVKKNFLGMSGHVKKQFVGLGDLVKKVCGSEDHVKKIVWEEPFHFFHSLEGLFVKN